MLTTPTLDKLHQMNLQGFLKAFEQQTVSTDLQELTFEERLAMMVDAEYTERLNRRLRTRLKAAKLRLQACMADLDYRTPRGIDKPLVRSLADCRWIHDHLNVLITGSTGTGKTYLACALGHAACMEGLRVFYLRSSRLFPDLQLAKADGRYPRLMRSISRVDLIIVDDWGISTPTDEERRDMLEILEDRHDRASTIVTSQFPVDSWHDVIADPTMADAIIDRLIHNAYKIPLKGKKSMRSLKKLRDS